MDLFTFARSTQEFSSSNVDRRQVSIHVVCAFLAFLDVLGHPCNVSK